MRQLVDLALRRPTDAMIRRRRRRASTALVVSQFTLTRHAQGRRPSCRRRAANGRAARGRVRYRDAHPSATVATGRLGADMNAELVKTAGHTDLIELPNSVGASASFDRPPVRWPTSAPRRRPPPLDRCAGDLLAGLNPVQREAASAPDGPLLVVAGAGSGKTRVLTHRIAYLIAEQRVSPFGMLAITFTNKAAGEMKERVARARRPGRAAHVGVAPSTRRAPGSCAARRRGSGCRSSFTIYDQADAVRLTDYVRRDLNLDPKRFPPRQLHARISALKNELVGPAEALDRCAYTPPERTLAEVYTRVPAPPARGVGRSTSTTCSPRPSQLFREHPDVLARWRAPVPARARRRVPGHQPAQWELVRLLTEEHRNVMVVGDTISRVYRFRGADYRNLHAVRGGVPRRDVIVLEQNYRSTQRILDAANAVIANNAARQPKHLWTEQIGGELITRYQAEDEHDEAAFVVHEITRLTDTEGHRFGDVAVFYRTNAQSRVVEEALVRAGIPYRVVGGVKFYDRREVKDALAYLRALVNPDDEVSWKRIVNTPKRGVGDTSIAKVDGVRAGRGPHVPRRAAAPRPRPASPGKALGGIRDLLELMVEFERDDADGGVGRTVEAVLEHTGYLAELEAERTIEAQGRIENLQELVGVCREFDDALDARRRRRAPRHRRRRPPATERRGGRRRDPRRASAGSRRSSRRSRSSPTSTATTIEDQSAVTLMTLHTAKGLEFPVVFLIGLEDGMLPARAQPR